MSSSNGSKVWILKDPHFGATNFLSNFIFLFYLLVHPEIVICQAYTSKKCEFWHPHLRGTPIVVLPNFVKFYLFTFACSEKFHQSRVSGSVLNFGVLVWGGSLHFAKFRLIFILSILKISSVQRKWLNFKFWCPCLKRIFHFGTPKFRQILSFLHICIS